MNRPNPYMRGSDLMKEDRFGQVIEESFQIWRHRMGFAEVEKRFTAFDRLDLVEAHRAVIRSGGWLKLARKALSLSTTEAARNCGISRPAFHKLEKAEALGRITLATLANTADHLGMDVIYGFRPRQLPSRQIWSRLAGETLQKIERTSIMRGGPSRRIVGLATSVFMSPKIRQREGWTERI